MGSAFSLVLLLSFLAGVLQPEFCSIATPRVELPNLREASGVAASRRSDGVLWAHNDSGQPILYALDTNGRVVGTIRVQGARVDDWEDIAVASCPSGTCIYIGDIGDNKGSRESITIYRVPEPSPKDASTAAAEAFHASYPDGAHDAESLFVAPDGTAYIITKGDPGPVGLYRLRLQSAGSVTRLVRVGAPLATKDVEAKDRPTAADMSRDGSLVAFRTTQWLEFHRAAELTAGRWQALFRYDLSALRERRGEGLALAADGSVFLVGEAAGDSSGSFARLTCNVPK